MHTALDNSLNRGNINEILTWFMPRYSAGIEETTTSGQKWTAPKNGWVIAKFQVPNLLTWYHVYVNDVEIADVMAAECSYGTNVIFPVTAGDEVYVTVPDGGYVRKVTFYPCKGVSTEPPPASGYTMNGTVYVTDGVASNFSWWNYLKPDYSFAPAGKSFEIDCSIKVNSMSPDSQYFFGSNEYDTDPLGFNIGFESGHPMFQISIDGSSFGSSNIISDFTVSENTKYYFKLTYDGNGTYTFGISTDKTNWTTITVSGGTIGDNTAINIGGAYHRDNNQYLRGEMDLNDMSLSIDGNVVWTAV